MVRPSRDRGRVAGPGRTCPARSPQGCRCRRSARRPVRAPGRLGGAALRGLDARPPPAAGGGRRTTVAPTAGASSGAASPRSSASRRPTSVGPSAPGASTAAPRRGGVRVLGEAGQLAGDALEVGERGAAGGQRLLAAAQGRDQLAGALDVLLVVELVVDGDHRRVVAGGQALGVLEGDRAVGGGLVVVDAEVVAERVHDPLAAEHAAQRVGADADQVPAGRAALVHRVEGRDRADLGLGQAELLGAERDALGRDVALHRLHQVQHRQQRRAGHRVAGHDLARLEPGLLGQRRQVERRGLDRARVEPGHRRPLGRSRKSTHQRSHSPHDGVDRGDRGDDVGDHAALAHRRRGLQVHEAWVAHVDAPRAGAAVADHVVAELAAGRLDRHVHLAGRDPEALGDQLEVVDQGLHRLAHDVPDVVEGVAHAVGAQRQLRGPGDLAVLDHDRAGLEPVERLLDELQRLVHLGHADQVAAPGVGGVGGRHLEVVGLVAEVGLDLAQVPGQAGGPQDRAGDAEREAAGDVEVADVLEPRAARSAGR